MNKNGKYNLISVPPTVAVGHAPCLGALLLDPPSADAPAEVCAALHGAVPALAVALRDVGAWSNINKNKKKKKC